MLGLVFTTVMFLIAHTIPQFFVRIFTQNETYVELMKRLPDVGNRVLTELGEGRVRSINMISETLMVEYKDTIRKHDASEILKILDRKVKKEEIQIDPELKQLID